MACLALMLHASVSVACVANLAIPMGLITPLVDRLPFLGLVATEFGLTSGVALGLDNKRPKNEAAVLFMHLRMDDFVLFVPFASSRTVFAGSGARISSFRSFLPSDGAFGFVLLTCKRSATSSLRRASGAGGKGARLSAWGSMSVVIPSCPRRIPARKTVRGR